jgi:hypothetical protein
MNSSFIANDLCIEKNIHVTITEKPIIMRNSFTAHASNKFNSSTGTSFAPGSNQASSFSLTPLWTSDSDEVKLRINAQADYTGEVAFSCHETTLTWSLIDPFSLLFPARR